MQIDNYLQYQADYDRSIQNPEQFWAGVAQHFVWQQAFERVIDWNFTQPNIQWFVGGKLNITENCLDRHLATRSHQTAIIWEPNDPQQAAQHISYQTLYDRVCQVANVLLRHGVTKGDRVCLYMPMIPELAIAVLACARIGAVHSVVFGGFSAQSLADRINDAQACMLITANCIYRGNKQIPAKAIADEALAQCPSIRTVLVAQCGDLQPNMHPTRDYYLDAEMLTAPTHCPPEPMDSEDALFILYTSGSTGKPKGVVHTCGGYMVYTAYSFQNVFQYQSGDVYWCTADIGWITGHSYIVYAPLLCGATTLMFEGIPTYPQPDRFWQVIDKHRVNQFYTAPTAIRSLMAEGNQWVAGYQLSSLKTLGSVGEPINEEAWHWYSHHIGKDRCPIVDTWWQTETGGIMLSALAGISPTKPAHAGQPLPGVQLALLTPNGTEIHTPDTEGLLCIKYPVPSMLRTIYGDHERCRQTYFSAFEGYYFTGDAARRTADGLYRIIGRVDDVMNVSGHRIGTAEVENAINSHAQVVESAVVGYPHPIKGQGIYAYVIGSQALHTLDAAQQQQLQQQITAAVERQIGKIARPDVIQLVAGLPKTRSGKIMRRILRKIAEGDTSQLGDTSTLLDPSVVDAIKAGATHLTQG